MRTLKIYALLLAVLLIGGSKAFAQCTFAVITGQPTNQTICANTLANASFSVAATGTGPLVYQWQANSGSGFANVVNGSVYGGANTATLTLTNPPFAMNITDHRCLVTAACGGPTVTSSGAVLIINTKLTINSHPTSAVVCPGGNASFTVGATALSGNSTIAYQWQQDLGFGWSNVTNGGIYSGATTATLSLTNVPANTIIGYRCLLSSFCDPLPTGVLSNTASIATYNVASIATNPSSVTICPGQSTSFSVGATGSGLTYQWQVNTGSGFTNVPVGPGYITPNSATLLIVNTTASMNGYTYRCEVKGQCGAAVQSTVATLNVNSATSITTNPSNTTACQGTNVNFTVVAAGTTPFSYQWQQWNGSTFVNLTAAPPYQGTTDATLTIQSVTPSMNLSEYRCMATGTCGSAASTAAVLTVNASPSITIQPVNSSVCAGSNNTNFSVNVTGAGPITYQWQGDNGVSFVNLTNTGIYSGVNTASLSITGATAANNASNYRCVVGGGCAPTIISNSATLTVNTSPNITIHPVSMMVCEAANANLSIVASGSGLSYQWQESVNGGISYNNLNNTAPFSGATSATLTITSATNSLNNGRYRCFVTGTCTPSQLSSAATLTVNALPVVNTSPVNTTVCSGTNATFSVTANAGSITYQWQVNTGSGFANIIGNPQYIGNMSADLTVQNTTAGMSGFQYRCIIGGICGPVATSAAATLTVNTIPTIVSNPSPVVVCPAATTSFTVVAIGTGLTYQWQVNTGSGFTNLVNGGVYSNTTSPTLNLTGVTYSMNGSAYRCVTSGTCLPQATSTSASLAVHATPVLTSQTGNTTVCAGSNTSFGVTTSGTGLTYQWQVNTGSGFFNLTNTGVYSGTTTGTLGITGALAIMNGYQYQCYIVGTCSPIITSAPAVLTVNTLPVITSNPLNTTVCATYPATFSVVATGTSLGYVWQVNTGSGFVNCSGSAYQNVNSPTLTVLAPDASYNGYSFRCIVSGICAPSQTSSVVVLSVFSLPTIVTQPTTQSICANSNAVFTIAGSGTGVIYQWQENKGTGFLNLSNSGIYSGVNTTALVITGAPYSMNGWGYRCVITGTCFPTVISNSVSLAITPLPSITSNPTDQTSCFNTTSTFTVYGFATSYQWQEFTGTVWTNMSNIGVYAGVNTNVLTINNTPASLSGNMYRCILGTGCPPNVTTTAATLTVYAYPVINTQPTTQTVCEGTTATFFVNATGLLLEYQWEVNTGVGGWQPIQPNLLYLDTKSPTLSVVNFPFSMNGYAYRCKVTSNGCNTYTYTNEVNIVINQKPYIVTQPVSRLVTYKTQGQIKFWVKANGAGPFTYQWQADTSLPVVGRTFFNMTNNSVYSGVNADTMVITNPPYWAGHKNYRCIVTGLCAPAVTSGNAVLYMTWANDGVANVAKEVDVRLYPNPVTGSELNLVIADAVSRNLSVKITNNFGSLLVNQNVTLDNGNAATINIGDLAAGVYNLQVADKDNNLVKTIRFVKQ